MYGIQYEHDDMSDEQLDARWEHLMKVWKMAYKRGDLAAEKRTSRELDHIEFEWQRRARNQRRAG